MVLGGFRSFHVLVTTEFENSSGTLSMRCLLETSGLLEL